MAVVTVAQAIAATVEARLRCCEYVRHPERATRVLEETEDGERLDVTARHWASMAQAHKDRIQELTRTYLPRGSGWDSGTTMDLLVSTPNHLLLYGGYHHMTEGSYDGWTDHVVHVRPSLAHGLDLRITGPNRNGIKEYLYDLFYEALTREVRP